MLARESAVQALAAPREARATPKQIQQDSRWIHELEREIRRKEMTLAEPAALLDCSACDIA